jgi:hypothetical protein
LNFFVFLSRVPRYSHVANIAQRLKSRVPKIKIVFLSIKPWNITLFLTKF